MSKHSQTSNQHKVLNLKAEMQLKALQTTLSQMLEIPSDLQSQLQKSEKIRQQTVAAELKLDNLLRKQQTLESDIDKETDRLLVEREAKLKAIDNDHKLSLNAAEAEQIKLESKNTELTNENYDLSISTNSKQAKLDKINVQIYDGIEELNRIKTGVEEQIRNKKEALSEINTLNNSKNTLISEINELKQEIEQLEAKKEQYMSDYEDKMTQLNKSHAQLVKKIDELTLENRRIVEANRKAEIEQDFIRKDLAKRATMADEREKVLKRREMTVAQSEDTIQQNANLLNL